MNGVILLTTILMSLAAGAFRWFREKPIDVVDASGLLVEAWKVWLAS